MTQQVQVAAEPPEVQLPALTHCPTCGSRLVRVREGLFTSLACVSTACCDGLGQR